eukprot:CAMPEP_0205905246 /NCGR_PEP_ID=MMETSP1325-20131115/1238_1 /ASSEMBLY_ACC=CAM_ASM_000708 /TAXON_ID=236786 /ORGANISM="Florenciella sp., Strain RCC1007" /LENGTH=33 /DNA_ID= /DNA_START= /DNA_END= /DNA_ORIENTATION=
MEDRDHTEGRLKTKRANKAVAVAETRARSRARR